jgi:large subunit ribosomal protein L23
MSTTLLLKPRISEKAYGLSLEKNTYVFDVPLTTNRAEIEQAVAFQFSVTPIKVNVHVVKGKAKRTFRKGGRPVNGKRTDSKRAYVTLKEGDTIGIFASENDAKQEKPKKSDKKESK